MPLKKKSKTSKKGVDGGTKKRKKMTKEEKMLIKLEKQCDVLKASGEPFWTFVNRMDRWILAHGKKAQALFQKYDADSDGVLTYDEFKSGLFDLNIPCNQVELHLLVKLLDRDNLEEIDYEEFGKGLQFVREEAQFVIRNDVQPLLMTTDKIHPRCICCQMQICEPYREKDPKYIELIMKLVTFDTFKQHPGHFNRVVHSHLPTDALVSIIAEETHIESSTVTIFTDKTMDMDSVLPQNSTLEDCGFKGGSFDHPEELLLYYDYKVEFKDCPILMCDHYFGQKLKIGKGNS